MYPEDAPFPGPYQLDMTPYMREPMDALCDEEVEEISVQAAAQVSKSTTIENQIGWIIENDPAPSLYLTPTETAVSYVAQERIAPMIENSPALRRHWSGKPQDLQGDVFNFDRMSLFFTWAGSDMGVAMRTIKYLFRDEPNKYPAFSGRTGPAGDRAAKRTTTFWDAKIVTVCTPTVPGGFIETRMAVSTRERIYVPCPRCGEYQVWKFGQLKVPPALHDPDKIRETGDVWYECDFCEYQIRETEKAACVAAHKWIPEGQTIDGWGNVHGQALRSRRHRGFFISGLVSPFPKASWTRIMAEWFEANTEEGIARGTLMVWHNETEGESFEEKGVAVQASSLQQLKGGFSEGTVPEGCKLLVASADYHKTLTRGLVTIIYEVRGFGYGLKNWVITSGSVQSFEELDRKILLSPFPWSDGTSNEQRPWPAVQALFVDAGYKPDDVFDYCRQRIGLTIPIIGVPGPCAAPLRWTDVEAATERRLSEIQRRRYRGMRVGLVDTHHFKGRVMSWAQGQYDEEGRLIMEARTGFYNEIPSLYFTEFTNEQLITIRDKNGNAKQVWKEVTTGAATHSLDTAVYAAAAGFYKGAFYMKEPGAQGVAPAAAQRIARPGRRIGRIER
jgi:phage terminase large subunit GpA-like protein